MIPWKCQEKILCINISHMHGGYVEIIKETSSSMEQIWRLIHGG